MEVELVCHSVHLLSSSLPAVSVSSEIGSFHTSECQDCYLL